MKTEKENPVSVTTEPIFNIHIDFADGSNPIIYYNLSLARALDVLKEWCEEWILSPDNDCKLNGATWYWHARRRELKKQSVYEPESEQMAIDISSILEAEFTEPEE